MDLLSGWWIQLWPNLVADVLAVGVGLVWHHRRTKRLLDALHQRVEHLHAKVDRLGGGPGDATGGAGQPGGTAGGPR